MVVLTLLCHNNLMQMTIHNPNKLPLIDYRVVKPLQENLKDLHAAEHDKLLNILTVTRGFKQPINLWHKGDEFFLMDGHQRQRVMLKNDLSDDGSYDVPYLVTEAATKKEAVEQLLEVASQFGKTMVDGFDELTSMYELDLSSLDVHFDAIDMDKFLDDHLDADEADDEAPEVDEVNPPVSVLGEVYQLGAHRLMCGDSTSLEAVERLMDGAKADMVFTDPPYGINLDSATSKLQRNKDGWVSNTKDYGKILNDDKPYDPSHIFEMFDCKEIFLWGADYYTKLLPDNGSWTIWDKREENSSDTMLGSMFEVCWSKTKHRKEIIRVRWVGILGTESQDIRSRVHPTQKPLQICAPFINKYSKKDNIIVDVFGGSGSTLIACERAERTCYMMELDPKYADVIRKRYAKHIGAEDWQAVTPAVEYANA